MLLSVRLRFSVEFSYATLAKLLSLYVTMSIVCAALVQRRSGSFEFRMGFPQREVFGLPPQCGRPDVSQHLCINLDYHPQEL